MKDKDEFCLQGNLRTFLLLNLISKTSVTPENYCKSTSFFIELDRKKFLIRRFSTITNIPNIQYVITTRYDGRTEIVIQFKGSSVCNLITGSDRLLCEEWFNGIRNFDEGFAVVYRRCENADAEFEYNWIDLNGKLLGSTWYSMACAFHNGLARFKDKTSGLWNFIRHDGSLLDPIGYNAVDDFQKDGYAEVSKDKKWNFIDKDGKYLSSTWYLSIRAFKYGFAVVQRIEDKKYNWIRKDGSLLSQRWYDKCIDFNLVDNKPISICEVDGISYFIDVDGRNLNGKI